MVLANYHTENVLECGVDEAGRGPAIGRMYSACVFWPKDLEAPQVKDSKKFKNAEEREKVELFIKQNAIAYGIAYIEADEIDTINIHQANLKIFHQAIRNTYINPDHILVDGVHFKPFCDQNDNYISYTTVIGGDNKYTSIAAASILAKCEHDRYIRQLCQQYPLLNRYGLCKGMGYATPEHLEAIQKYGITQFHRQSYKCCQGVSIQYL